MRIILCNAQVPFVRGGAELLVEGLRDALKVRGHQVDIVTIPYRWQPHQHLLDAMLAWRLIDLSEVDGHTVDLVIATKFPSYFIKHPRKVVWLVHQHRQAYDWYGTPFSDFVNDAKDRHIREQLIRADTQALSEATQLFAISQNVARRLQRFNFLQATPLYPPSKFHGQFVHGAYGAYILCDARLDAAKRLDLFLQAVALMKHPAPVMVTSTGPQHAQLAALAHQLGIAQRVTFTGYISDEQLIDLYADARCVYYAPYDEDYGFTTIQALEAARPVITTHDAGGTLEFVRHQHNGLIAEPHALSIAQALDRMYTEEHLAATLGTHGPASVTGIDWEHVCSELLRG